MDTLTAKPEDGERSRIGIVNFEKRRYPRFSIDLPVEYRRTHSSLHHTGRALNASQGGLLLYLPEECVVGQELTLKLFYSNGAELVTLEALGEVAWTEICRGGDRGDYRAGIRFVEIAPQDLDRLKGFLRGLSE
jgi:hypothetical protein